MEHLIMLVLVGVGAIHHFGFIEGLAVVSAVYLIMPYRK